jgi:hypothetical protein
VRPATAAFPIAPRGAAGNIRGMGCKMSRAGAWLALAALVGGCQAPPPEGASASTAGQLRDLRQCAAFDGLDMKAILQLSAERPPPDLARIEAAHREIRGGGELPLAEAAQVMLVTMAGPGETQSVPTHTSSVVWLDEAGAWRFDRVDYALRPVQPKPPPAGWDGSPYAGWTAEEEQELRRTRTSGVLAPGLAAAIERGLADPCFASQPDIMPFTLPEAEGEAPRPPCYGVLYGSLLLRWPDGRQRLLSEPCGGFYAGDVIAAVLYARGGAAD